MKRKSDFANADVAATFGTYPEDVRTKLLRVRRLILDVAATTDGVGDLEETLRWGEPSYLTTRSKSGSMIRIAWKKVQPERYAVYFHCQTNLVATFKQLYPAEFTYEGNRSISFGKGDAIPVDALRHCIALALTYHSSKRRQSSC